MDALYLHIQSADDMRVFLSPRSLLHRYYTVRMELPELTPEQNSTWERRVNGYYKACGCREGRLFVLAALLAFVLTSLHDGTLAWKWTVFGTGFLYCLAGALTGKAFGLLLSFFRLRTLASTFLSAHYGAAGSCASGFRRTASSISSR